MASYHADDVPVTFRIEYDEASTKLAKQVGDTAKEIAKRLGLSDLVQVAQVLLEPVPEMGVPGSGGRPSGKAKSRPLIFSPEES